MPKYAISLTAIVNVEDYSVAQTAADILVAFLEHHYLVEEPHYWNIEELEE